uniref:BED-type domain-containing protein n=1 Tax=Meloidogyne hapla TaxID=6305 RepID=A0A1I8B8D6_MELHA
MSTPSTSNRKKTSPFWNYFTIKDSKAVCNLCGTSIAFKPGDTSHLCSHMKHKHKNVEILKYRTEETAPCIFCSKEFNAKTSMDRHFREYKCEIKNFYTTKGWSLAFTVAIAGEVVPTDTLLTFMNENEGKSMVYVVSKGENVTDWLYVGVTTAFDSRFRSHATQKFFVGYGKLRQAVLIKGISMEKSHSEGLLIMANKHLKNKNTEYRNILHCIKCGEDELVHEKVAFWHRQAVQYLIEKWPTLDWKIFNNNIQIKNTNQIIPTTIAEYTSCFNQISPKTRRMVNKRANGFYSP